MSTVYRAVDETTGRQVAVKMYAAGASYDARTRQRREAVVSGELAHDGIVRLLDHGEHETLGDGTQMYLVTELVEGPTLRQRLAAEFLSAEQVRVVGARLASILGYLHDQGIVHRDIKPANVLLPGYSDSDLGKAVLADFGVAIRLDDTRVTTAGLVVGTATYLSPEQVTGAAITGATDVYALGLLLLELLSGVASFEGSGVECALARLHRPPDVPGTTPQWLAALLASMTRIAPDERPDAKAVELALREGSAAVVPTAPLVAEIPDHETSVLSDEPPKHGGRWLLALGSAAAFLTIFGMAVTNGNSADSAGSVPPASGPTTSAAVTAPASATSPRSLATASHAPSPVVAVVKQRTTGRKAPAPPGARKPHGGKGPGPGTGHGHGGPGGH